jgi:hypothetical protein
MRGQAIKDEEKRAISTEQSGVVLLSVSAWHSLSIEAKQINSLTTWLTN